LSPCIKGRPQNPKLLCCDCSVGLLYELVFDMEIDVPQADSQEDSRIRLYRRLLFCIEGNKSVGVQVATINDKLFVGLGKFWRQDGWKANRWAPGKKGNHIFLTVDQYRALISVAPKISNAVQLVEDLVHISTNEFEDISDSSAAVAASAGPGNAVSGSGTASLSTESVSAVAATTVDEPTSAVRGTDACDGELREPSASQDKDKKAQDVPSTTSKRKRGRPSNVPRQEGATPKASKSKSRKASSAAAAAPADAAPAAADIALEHRASADIVVLEH
jgi:hypothetical protein